MKKINFKQPKYILPLVALLPLVFLIYNVAGIFGGEETSKTTVVTDSINTALPEADEQHLEDKLSSMDKAEWGDDRYTAIGRLGAEEAEKEDASQGYTESELDAIDQRNAAREREQREREELERSLAESRRHFNSYQNPSSRGKSSSRATSRSQYDELEDYTRALEEIQQLNQRRSSSYSTQNEISPDVSSHSLTNTLPPKPTSSQPEIVHKAQEKGVEKFHTLSPKSSVDNALIKAIIDKTTKARQGTRLRFKLLDAITIKGIHLDKGTYLYGVVTGFSGQRVMASITSILIKDKFVKVNLSVYDNDGMEGFYVPASLFRTFVKDASAQAMQSSVNFNNNSTSELSAETMALQALQNVYSSATSAVSNNIRQDKARIKYNTTVYLINASQSDDNQ